MLSSGESAPADGLGVAMDRFGIAFHGYEITHLDSLGHIFWKRQGYNGMSSSSVSMVGGAERGSIDNARNGIVTRGVLLDMPSVLSVDWLEPGHAISPADLEKAENRQGVRVGPGDTLYIRTGRDARSSVFGEIDSTTDGAPGLDIACMPWIHDRSVSVLGSDYANDVVPSKEPDSICPVHIIGLVAMGLWLLDNSYLEILAQSCARRESWEFMSVISPLILSKATGSPVNPLAVL
jgi:kynurenine formamidase